MATMHTPIPSPDVKLESFTAYNSSEGVVRFFCSRCGAHMLDRAKKRDGENIKEQWFIATSLVDAEEEVWSFNKHIFVDSTGDGGLASWLTEISDKPLKLWRERDRVQSEFQERGDWSLGIQQDATKTGVKDHKAEEDKLRARCQCGGVDFYIARPRGEEAFKDMPPSLTPKDKKKWKASNDVCTSCRLLSGFAIVSWVFPAVDHIELKDGSPYPPSHVFGSIKSYESSEGVTRTFCGTCGALVAYACDDRPQMVDIGVGLLDAPSGVRAEEWLEWRIEKGSFEEDCIWPNVLASLKLGLKEWSKEQARDGGEGHRR